jgi:hypothetical protein
MILQKQGISLIRRTGAKIKVKTEIKIKARTGTEKKPDRDLKI